MKYTTFNSTVSQLTSYNTIGYDKNSETLQIKFLNGEEKTYYHVPELTIFKLLISEDKESFYREHIENHYSEKHSANSQIIS